MSINPKLGYSDKTQALIERMCANVERRDFELDKEKCEELILKTYDLFNLDRPKKIVWCNDIYNTEFSNAAKSARSAWSAKSARSAWSAGSAESAWSAKSAGSARSAESAWSAGSAGSAESAWSAGSAGSAESAWSAGSARSAGSAWSAGSAGSALDYDFDYFIFEFEYCENPDKDNLPNKNDRIYLEYCDLLMQAKEAGLGYRVEHDDTLYLVPTPIVRINDQNQFHSEIEPAIKWKNGSELYFLDGQKFGKDLWTSILSKTMSFDEIIGIENSDQRTIALKYNPQAILNAGAKLVDKSERGNELYLIENQKINEITEYPKVYFLKMTCPTGRVFIEAVDPQVAEITPKADVCQAVALGLTYEQYKELKPENES